MKKITMTILLTPLARLYLARFKPRIVGVTGNAGKTSTKDAIAAVLSTKYRVRATGGNLNNELGMPATIIGDFADRYYAEGGTWAFWISVFFRGLAGLFGSGTSYPEVLVLEYGAGKPGDIQYLVKRFPPHVAVVTHVGAIPVHVEFFASPEHLAQEKRKLVEAVPVGGSVILNFDDLTVLDMRSHSVGQVSTFGFGEGADVQITDLEPKIDGTIPAGLRFNLHSGEHTMPVRVNGALGRGIANACAAAVAVASRLGVGLAQAAEALSAMHTPPGRMRILAGVKGATIIDDTYNASPAAVHLALDGIAQLPGRKFLVLGDMLELGKHEVQAHQDVGSRAGAIASELVCVGRRAKFIAEAASTQLQPSQIHWYEDSRTAAPQVQRLMQSGDLVLVKGSQGMRMERIVQEIMAQPQRAGELLVRQSTRWLAK